jgi:hypothetical protein
MGLSIELYRSCYAGYNALMLCIMLLQEAIHLRNRELLIFKAKLQASVEEAQRQLDEKNARERLQTPRMSSPVNA